MSELVFNHGAMNSGKSNRLITMAYNLAYETTPPQPFVVIKPGVDTKGENFIVSRPMGEEKKLEVDIIADPEMDLTEAVRELAATRELARFAFALVDEAQFLKAAQVDQLLTLAKTDETRVYAFGIKTDYMRRLFEGSQRLVEVADSLEKLVNWCRCGEQAEFNGRYTDGVFVFEESAGQIAIDDNERTRYSPFCHNCYEEELQKATLALAT